MNKKIYVANWKMTMSPEKSSTFISAYSQDLNALSESATLIMCPSFVSLGILSQAYTTRSWLLGAQDCSEHTSGSFTGDVDAATLQSVGCSYCIIGHSERRMHHHETDKQIAQKVAQLHAHDITPIVCVGETAKEQAQNKTTAILEQQLVHLAPVYTDKPFGIIAYEPRWAIGTGNVPTSEQLTTVFAWLKAYCATHMPTTHMRLLYGGSVTPENSKTLKAIAGIDGFLIGAASRDFQKFKNIVL